MFMLCKRRGLQLGRRMGSVKPERLRDKFELKSASCFSGVRAGRWISETWAVRQAIFARSTLAAEPWRARPARGC